MINNLKKNKIFAGFIVIAFTIFLTISCSVSEPVINYGFISMVLYQGDPDPVEHFSFFVMCEDEDGIENLDVLYLYHDREQLRWQVKSDEWLLHTFDGRNWIGTRNISVPDGNLPRGVFRAVLVNKGGESTERNFTYDGAVRFSFPELTIYEGEYSIISQWPVNRLVCYDGSGNYSGTVTLTSKTGNIADLRLPSSARVASLWAEDEANSCRAFTDAVSLN